MREIIDILTGHYRDEPARAGAANETARGPSGRRELLTGLRRLRKELSPKWLLDRRGCDLLAALRNTADSDQARAELGLIRACARPMAEMIGEGACLVELGGCDPVGSGLLLAELRHPLIYMPVGQVAQTLWSGAMQLQLDHPYLAVRPLVADFSALTELPDDGPWLHEHAAFTLLGGATTTLPPVSVAALLRRIGGMTRRNLLFVGVDLKAPAAQMEAAYNDRQGLAAELNSNLLVRLNREVGADFDLSAFGHVAFWNEACGRVEMHLESRRRQCVRVAGEMVSFDRGELLHTMSAYKYTVRQFQALARRAGYQPLHAWTDPTGIASLHALSKPEPLKH